MTASVISPVPAIGGLPAVIPFPPTAARTSGIAGAPPVPLTAGGASIAAVGRPLVLRATVGGTNCFGCGRGASGSVAGTAVAIVNFGDSEIEGGGGRIGCSEGVAAAGMLSLSGTTKAFGFGFGASIGVASGAVAAATDSAIRGGIGSSPGGRMAARLSGGGTNLRGSGFDEGEGNAPCVTTTFGDFRSASSLIFGAGCHTTCLSD